MYQKRILDQLRSHGATRYAELQPDEVESSHFKYHLNQMIKQGFVERIDRGVYQLTTEGESHVDTLSSGRIVPYESPKVITYTLLYDDKNYYLFKKPNLPYKDTLNMCGGRHHVEESAQQASSREIREKAGIEITDQQQHGWVEVIIRKDQKPYTHFIAGLFSCRVDSPPAGLMQIVKDDASLTKQLAPDQPALLKMILDNKVESLIQIDI